MGRSPRAERQPRPSLRWALLGWACLAGAGPLATARAAPAAPLELRGRWLVGTGPLHRGGRLRLRALDASRSALEITLPPSPLLARRQYLLREGEALLTWSEPVGARELLVAEDAWGRRLAALPADAWRAILCGDGIALRTALVEPGDEPGADWPTVRGRLGGHPARLRLRGERAWSLDWELPEGSLHCHWEETPGGGPLWLRARLPDGPWLRVAVRGELRPELGGADWLFLETSGNRRGRDAF